MNDAVALNQKSPMGMGKIAALALASGALAYGIFAGYSYKQQEDRKAARARLTAQAQALMPQRAAIGALAASLDAQAKSLPVDGGKNLAAARPGSEMSKWLAFVPDAPEPEALASAIGFELDRAKVQLMEDRAAVGRVAEALARQGDVAAMALGLGPANMAIYERAKECAVEPVVLGAYCGLGDGPAEYLAQVATLRDASEAEAREKLASGWDDWDGAQKALTEGAQKEIAAAEAEAKGAFDRGELEAEDWESMQAGFVAARSTASEQIASDRRHLEAGANSGGLSALDWFLIMHMMRSSPSQSMAFRQGSSRPAPYARGGSAFKEPARSTPPARQEQARNLAAGKAATAPAKPAEAAGAEGLAMAGSVGAAGVAAAAVAAKRAKVASVSPYSTAPGSHLGAKVNASFDRAAPRTAEARPGSAGGLGGRVKALARSRSRSTSSYGSGGSSSYRGSSAASRPSSASRPSKTWSSSSRSSSRSGRR